MARDSAVEKIKRIVKLNREVQSCTRKYGEAILHFIDRYASVGQRYLNIVSAIQDGAESHNFAIYLLTNSKVSSTTFGNVISSLVNHSKHRVERVMK